MLSVPNPPSGRMLMSDFSGKFKRNPVTHSPMPVFDPHVIPSDQPVFLSGPTASGKSRAALRIAETGGGMIINADALQVYACWRVLTARPSCEDLQRARHLLYGHIQFHARYSVGDWISDIKKILDFHPGQRPIIVGGTGLYFLALTDGLAEMPPVPAEVSERADRIIASEGPAVLANQLICQDPRTAERIDIDNPRRVRRAWEVFAATGRGLADWQEGTELPALFPLEPYRILIEPDRQWLAARIETRVAAMLRDGAIAECERLLPIWKPDLPAAKALGARELIAYLRGKATLAETETVIATSTRRYAKRQRTWFRSRMPDWIRLLPDSNHIP